MNKWMKAQWLAALRGGSYKQGKYRLKSKHNNGEYRYCCLGVLSEVCGLKSSGQILNDAALLQAGFSVTTQKLLAQMNDGTSWATPLGGDGVAPEPTTMDFNKIADWIEKNL